MNQFMADLDSLNRIAFHIGNYRSETGLRIISQASLTAYLKLHLSIQDWILWLRISSCLASGRMSS